MFGLIAEDVEKVDPSLVTRNDKGEVEAVRYDAVNAMLLNEFLKEHREVQEQRKQIEKLTAELKEQGAHIRRVNDKVELNEPTAQIVENDQ
jgi:1,4-alpha-glucan branching enzyme